MTSLLMIIPCLARLRKKLEAVGLKDFIETKKGVGYGLRHDG